MRHVRHGWRIPASLALMLSLLPGSHRGQTPSGFALRRAQTDEQREAKGGLEETLRAAGLEEGVALPLDEASKILETYRRAEGVNAVQVGPSGPVRRLFTQADNTLTPMNDADRTKLLEKVAVQNRVVLQPRQGQPLLVRAPTAEELRKAGVATGLEEKWQNIGAETSMAVFTHGGFLRLRSSQGFVVRRVEFVDYEHQQLILQPLDDATRREIERPYSISLATLTPNWQLLAFAPDSPTSVVADVRSSLNDLNRHAGQRLNQPRNNALNTWITEVEQWRVTSEAGAVQALAARGEPLVYQVWNRVISNGGDEELGFARVLSNIAQALRSYAALTRTGLEEKPAGRAVASANDKLVAQARDMAAAMWKDEQVASVMARLREFWSSDPSSATVRDRVLVLTDPRTFEYLPFLVGLRQNAAAVTEDPAVQRALNALMETLPGPKGQFAVGSRAEIATQFPALTYTTVDAPEWTPRWYSDLRVRDPVGTEWMEPVGLAIRYTRGLLDVLA